MGISLNGVEAWRASDELPPGAYVAKATNVEPDKSQAGNPQAVVDWRVAAGEYTGAEKRDWVTITEPAMGRVVQLIEACGQEVPQQDFASFEALRDWLVEMLRKGPAAEMILRNETYVGRDGDAREGTKIKGYRRPTTSDIPSDTSEFASGPNVATGPQKDKLPF